MFRRRLKNQRHHRIQKDWRDDVVGYFTKKWNERVTIIKAGIGLAKKLLGMKKKEKTEEEKLEEMSSDLLVSARPSSPRTENGWKGMKRYLLMGNRCCCADAVSCAVTEDV